VILPYKEHLKRLGIEMRVRKVGPSDYIHRLRNFDYDMTTYVFDTHFTPGNELYDYWSSTSASVSGSGNIAGLDNKSVDEMVHQAIQSSTREELQTRIRALDRYLMWEQIVVPQWYLDVYRVAYWNNFTRPRVSPTYDLGLMTWWFGH
jgi:microcin C transport system substrate-binding protein